MYVKDWMTKAPVCAGETLSVAEAASRMKAQGVGSILILGPAGTLTGIFTERDLLNRVVGEGKDPAATTLGEVMTPNPQTLAPMDDVVQAYRRLLEREFRHLPVVRDGKPIGMISLSTPHLADLLIVAEYHLGRTAQGEHIADVVNKDFEDELTDYVREEFGTKVYKEYIRVGKLEVLKDRVRAEFRKIYREKTGTRFIRPETLKAGDQ